VCLTSRKSVVRGQERGSIHRNQPLCGKPELVSLKRMRAHAEDSVPEDRPALASAQPRSR
jgi:hypothetical protein